MSEAFCNHLIAKWYKKGATPLYILIRTGFFYASVLFSKNQPYKEKQVMLTVGDKFPHFNV
ncbi:MAG: hypothetical protein ACK59C_07010, partial [Holosporales bacterium]